MSAKDIVTKVSAHLKEHHMDVPMASKEGTWTSPGEISFEVRGERHRLEYWAGGDDKRIAQAVLDDVLTVYTAPHETKDIKAA